MQIGAKIYYNKLTGNKIFTIGDMQGFIEASTMEQDIQTYSVLSQYNNEHIGLIQLEYGELDKLMIENNANSYKVDVSTDEHKLIFEFVDVETGEPVPPPKTIEQIIEEKVNEKALENASAIAELVEKSEKDKLDLEMALAEILEMNNGGAE